MDIKLISEISKELKVPEAAASSTLALLEEGNTVPFIARYRKEATGGMDEEQILFIEKQYKYGINLQERKDAVIEIISQQGKLTPEIEADIRACSKLSQVEDLYRPYKEKKKTRAGMAIKKGLQPLAQWLLDLSQSRDGDVRAKAEEFLSDQVETWQEALQGAEDIIAEQVSDDAKLRWSFKEHINKHGSLVTSKKKDAEDPKKTYEMYYDRTEAVTSLADHRIMAINRAEKEKVITVSFSYDRDSLSLKACQSLLGQYTPDSLELPAFPGDEDTISPVTEISRAAADGCKRLLFPSIENEIRRDLTDRACASSIEVFSSNLESLLSQPPIKGRVVLAFDPGYANGCKLAVLDETGKMLTVDKIFPFKGKGGLESSKERLLQLIRKYDVKIVAIGNGTASRESESLVSDLIKENDLDLSYAIVSEAGASVWSAQEDARKEFPDMPVEERSAVSIGRRLLDPLPELIKIDPRSIGVGQYQHDLPEKALTERLDEATMKVVNRVGADLNTASPALLKHISGLNAGIAQEIVNYRNENGAFTNRKQLLKVKKLGPKAFTQCAGFLRIINGDEPLDQTSIHPESYDDARKVMKACGIERLGQEDAVFPEEAVSGLGIDSYTLKDIEDAIRTPLRDYRDQFDGVLLKSDALEIDDLQIGDELYGTVRNVVAFGAFVDIGLHSDGLVHITRMSRQRVDDPSTILSVGDVIKVWVVEIDKEKERVGLSLLSPEELTQREAERKNRNRGQGRSQNRGSGKRNNGGRSSGGNGGNGHRKSNNDKGSSSLADANAKLLAKFGKKH